MRDDSSQRSDGGASIAIVVGLALLLVLLVVGSLGLFLTVRSAPTPTTPVSAPPPQGMTIEPAAPVPDAARGVPGETSIKTGEAPAAPASTPAREAVGGAAPAGT